MKILRVALFTILLCNICTSYVDGYSITAPVLGLGAIFSRPQGTKVRPSLGDRNDLSSAGVFFTDAFWASKLGKDLKELSSAQRKTLLRQQQSEFAKRYGQRLGSMTNDRRAELILCENGKGELMGCAGIEIDSVSNPNDQFMTPIQAPLMSNVAVGKKFRRKGLAEDLVKAAEDLVRRNWGYDECYLLVEKKNTAAVRLYRKLGYSTVWEDKTAKTLTPTKSGAIKTTQTVIVCMRKRLGLGVFGRLF